MLFRWRIRLPDEGRCPGDGILQEYQNLTSLGVIAHHSDEPGPMAKACDGDGLVRSLAAGVGGSGGDQRGR